VKFWEIIADRLSAAGWSWGCVSAVDSYGQTIWIVDAHRDDGKRFIVHADWSSHPNWSDAKTYRPIINAKNKVRITGWLMWDYEHKEQLGNTRRTLWEVHPIHSIQVLSGSRWVTL
jgi:hypothetical protein